MRTPAALALMLLLPACLSAAGARKYGQPLALKDEVKVAEILANPDAYAGKKVRVKGLVTEVCEERGCWIKIGADKKEIMFKVEDGVIAFPMAAKGGTVVAEGTVSKRVLSVEQQKAMCDKEAKALSKPADYGKINGPKTMNYPHQTETAWKGFRVSTPPPCPEAGGRLHAARIPRACPLGRHST